MPETIVAIATPPGTGGVGIVRLSGPDAVTVASALCDTSVASLPPRELALTTLALPDGLTDEALVARMPAPHSYTGEDVVEVHAHGSPVVLDAIVRAAVDAGARLAEPGEFTKRAFLNARMDLSQAEAVSDLIYARTAAAARCAGRQLAGGLRERIGEVRDAVLHVVAELEAGLDFSEEELDLPSHAEYARRVATIASQLDALLKTAEVGALLREGATAVLVGRPNAGKSSLFNALLRRERAIVTAEAGTTRDTLDAEFDLDGVAIRLVDTAGLREAQSEAEAMGVQRSRAALAGADVVLWVVDRSQPLAPEDECVNTDTLSRTILLYNKADLPDAGDRSAACAHAAIEVSAKTGTGLDALHAQLRAVLHVNGALEDNQPVLVRDRHVESVRAARKALDAALDGLCASVALDCVAVDLHAALDALGNIAGRTTADDVLNRIFSEFCIGK